MKNILSVLIIFTFVFSVQAQSGSSYQKRVLEFEKALLEKITKEEPGLSVVITHKDDIILEKYYGFANLEEKEKLDSNHVFGIASMSKQFTGMATLLLVNEGKIDLNGYITDYFPDLPVGDRKITIKQLLSHTSGLPELTQNADFMNGIEQKHTINKIIDVAFQGEFRGEPGDKFTYCNTGYTIMAALIEKQSGVGFSTFLKDNIFTPFNMNSTYSCDYNQDAYNVAKRYAPDSLGYTEASVMHFSNLIGGGGVVSNVRDMAKWGMSLVSGVNLPQNYELIWESNLLNTRESTGYGLGMGENTYNGKTYYYHPGMGDGMNSINLVFLEDEITITVIRNVFPPKVRAKEIAFLAVECLFAD